jgi:hypothetical protein
MAGRRWRGRVGWAVLGGAVMYVAMVIYPLLTPGIAHTWHPPASITDDAMRHCNVYLRRPLPNLTLFGSNEAQILIGPTADAGTILRVPDDKPDAFTVKWTETDLTITERDGTTHVVHHEVCADPR